SRQVPGSARQPANKPAQGFASSTVFRLSRTVLCRRSTRSSNRGSNAWEAVTQQLAAPLEFQTESAECGGLLSTSDRYSRSAVWAYGTECSCRVVRWLVSAPAARGNYH